MSGPATRKAWLLGPILAASALFPPSAVAAPFAPTSLLVLGSGGQPANTLNLGIIDGVNRNNGLTDTPSSVFVREFGFASPTYTGAATLRQSITLPTVATTSGNRAFTLASNSGSEGSLTRSADGRFVTALGYNDTARSVLITQSANGQSAKASPAVVNRVVARIDAGGGVNTATALSDAFNGDNARGAVSTDGSQFWTTGNVSGAAQADSGGVRYATLGASTSARVAGADNGFTRNTNKVGIFDGQLYASTRNGAFSGVWAIGAGTSATTQGSGTPVRLFSYDATALGGQGPYDFVLLHDDDLGLGNGLNTAYVADSIIGISKFTKSGTGLWAFAYTINSTGGRFETNGGAGGITGLTGVLRADGNVDLFGVSGFNGTGDTFGGNRLIRVTDTGAGASYDILATAGATEHFSGVALAPVDVPEPGSVALLLTGVGFAGAWRRRANHLRAA